jgi:hypothetical protein
MLDASWYWLIGTLDNAHTGYQCDPSLNCGVQLVVYANDGFIDHRSAGFDANHARVIQGDLAHTEQTKADVVATAIKQALNIDIGISLRSPANDPPTPTALSATIAGPSQTPPAAWCVWSAQISGGRAPYTFTWNLGRSRGSWTEYTTPQSDFTMQVNVTDVDGRTASNILPVSVYSGAPSCSG